MFEHQIDLYEDRFAGSKDWLDRAKFGSYLSAVVERLTEPQVIALDGGWGSGKSHFLKLWCGQHSHDHGDKTTVVYFDAFMHDYFGDPLTALTAAVEARLPKPKQDSTTWKKVRSAAPLLARGLGKAALSLATAGASHYLEETGDAVLASASGSGADAIDSFWVAEKSKQKAMTEFGELLSQFCADEDAKIVIVVDELDRCRPDFALDTIEVMKHFFQAKGVHFILGINLEEFSNVVAHRYGIKISEKEYLQKFVTILTSLPKLLGTSQGEPDLDVYFRVMLRGAGFPELFSNCLERDFEYFSASGKLTSLRSINRIFGVAYLVPKNELDDKGKVTWPTYILSNLIFLQVLEPEFVQKLQSGEAVMADWDRVFRRVGADYNSLLDTYECIWSCLLEPNSIRHPESVVNFFQSSSGLSVPRQALREHLDDCFMKFDMN